MRTNGSAGLWIGLLLCATCAIAAAAQAVARVSFIENGNVFLTANDGVTPVAASLNSPVMPGDGFETVGSDVRAEIQLNGSTQLRLGPDVVGRVVSEDARRIEMTAGVMELAMQRGDDSGMQVVTPTIALRTRYAGEYRIGLRDDGTATITVRSGECDVVLPHKTVTALAGTTLVVHGAADSASSLPAIARDGFDEFNAQRDRTHLAGLSDDAALPGNLAGYDDLAAYGQWARLPPGNVWVPQQSANWAPYRNGAWSYTNSYGWTWVGNEPWAWIPYHYGRWAFAPRFGWCWYPPIGFVQTWAPALVGFFGFGSNPWGFSGFGWVPLAPFEPYVPWQPGQRRPGPPPRMRPLATAFSNARFGGATVISERAWNAGDFSRASAAGDSHVKSAQILRDAVPAARIAVEPVFATVPSLPSIAPVAPVAAPGASVPSAGRMTAPVLHPASPARPTAPIAPVHAPVMREPSPPKAVRTGSFHPPA